MCDKNVASAIDPLLAVDINMFLRCFFKFIAKFKTKGLLKWSQHVGASSSCHPTWLDPTCWPRLNTMLDDDVERCWKMMLKDVGR